MSTFRNLNFPSTYKYSSDSEHIPLEFYNNVFPVSKKIDLFLGYFSSNAIKVLSKCFAEFVANDGEMRIITNHVYSLKDKENLIDENILENEDKIIDIFNDLEKLEFELSDYGQHFFDCLKYLQKNKRLIIQPVKFNNVDLAHCKRMILYDGTDYISTDGSINFTLSALTKNSESFEVNVPWINEVFEKRVVDERIIFEKVFNGEHPNYKHISSKNIEVVINNLGNDKDKQDLLEDSIKIDDTPFGLKVKQILKKKKERFLDKISQIKISENKPHFPVFNGKISEPRPYQIEAYKAWKKNNNFSGIFAMATGTGKTITSLNCLLNEYRDNQYYRALILVPSIPLLNQWEDEVKAFNFMKILKVGGANNWETKLATYVSNFNWGIKDDIIIISTYDSFVSKKFFKYFKKIDKELLIIADEVHNMGANSVKAVLPNINSKKRIGLSATPKRMYDDDGNEAINSFFNDTPPYTYSFDMKRALDEGFLTEYKYFPKIVELDETEFDEYLLISKKLLKFFDSENKQLKKNPTVEFLLLKRKNIIHKAVNKILCYKSILKDLKRESKLQFVFTYVPEGYSEDENGERERIIDKFILAGSNTCKDLRVNSYTGGESNLKDILRGFSEGRINMLYAMKMLDEGVDIPRAEVGIFCSSTGNPRQFIQRRGRLLRKHPAKTYATIYDMVVIPKLSNTTSQFFNMEKNLVIKEIRRIAHFASLSINYYDTVRSLENVLNKYDINLDNLTKEL